MGTNGVCTGNFLRDLPEDLLSFIWKRLTGPADKRCKDSNIFGRCICSRTDEYAWGAVSRVCRRWRIAAKASRNVFDVCRLHICSNNPIVLSDPQVIDLSGFTKLPAEYFSQCYWPNARILHIGLRRFPSIDYVRLAELLPHLKEVRVGVGMMEAAAKEALAKKDIVIEEIPNNCIRALSSIEWGPRYVTIDQLLAHVQQRDCDCHINEGISGETLAPESPRRRTQEAALKALGDRLYSLEFQLEDFRPTLQQRLIFATETMHPESVVLALRVLQYLVHPIYASRRYRRDEFSLDIGRCCLSFFVHVDPRVRLAAMKTTYCFLHHYQVFRHLFLAIGVDVFGILLEAHRNATYEETKWILALMQGLAYTPKTGRYLSAPVTRNDCRLILVQCLSRNRALQKHALLMFKVLLRGSLRKKSYDIFSHMSSEDGWLFFSALDALAVRASEHDIDVGTHVYHALVSSFSPGPNSLPALIFAQHSVSERIICARALSRILSTELVEECEDTYHDMLACRLRRVIPTIAGDLLQKHPKLTSNSQKISIKSTSDSNLETGDSGTIAACSDETLYSNLSPTVSIHPHDSCNKNIHDRCDVSTEQLWIETFNLFKATKHPAILNISAVVKSLRAALGHVSVNVELHALAVYLSRSTVKEALGLYPTDIIRALTRQVMLNTCTALEEICEEIAFAAPKNILRALEAAAKSAVLEENTDLLSLFILIFPHVNVAYSSASRDMLGRDPCLALLLQGFASNSNRIQTTSMKLILHAVQKHGPNETLFAGHVASKLISLVGETTDHEVKNSAKSLLNQFRKNPMLDELILNATSPKKKKK